MKIINKYENPDFDVTIYEIEDIITASSPVIDFGKDDPDGGGDWFG